MSNEIDKPLAGALMVAQIIDDHCGCMVVTDSGGTYRQTCASCREAADIIARESGLAELVEAVEAANGRPESYRGRIIGVAISPENWNRIVAAARRVREG